MIELRLPAPPSVNALYRNVRGKGRAKTERYNTWLNAAGWALKEQKPAKIAGPYALWVYVEAPDKRRRDLGNSIKALEDLLVAHGVVEDDSQAAEIHLYRSGTGTDCTVRLEPAPVAAVTRRAA